MKILPEPLAFNWDKGNDSKSLFKHKITNTESEEVFVSSDFLLLKDPQYSFEEDRWIIIGRTKTNKILRIAFTIRGSLVRVISARPASRKERKFYEETIKNTKI